MQETGKDPTIKLFGQAIPLPGDADRQSPPPFHLHKQEQHVQVADDDDEEDEGEQQPQQDDNDQTHEDPGSENGTEREQEADPPPKTPSIEEEEEEEEEETPKSNDDNSEKEQSPEKTLKKPDKLLPCPRCNSMDTKFCYYNNYNVNQPRYFCKACQRYWTAGGTMRNVPVGAGRRKNKNSSSHYRHITISEALQAARIDAPNGTHIPALKSNGRVLSFGLDPPICDSMSSVLNNGENKVANGLEDQNQTQRFPVSCRSVENGDDSSSANSMGEGSKSKINFPQQQVVQNNGFIPQQLPCIPSVPWPYTWNTQVPVPPPAICPSGFPLPIYPAFWNCGVPGNWNVPWFPSASNSTPKSPSTGPNSPTLGKHSRDGDVITQDPLQKEEQSKQRNGSVLVPKTLRIDDPKEAAKSSIWATLGIKNESASGRRGMFNKSFQSTKGEQNQVEASSFLMANPAALSRSVNFHENS